MNTYLKNLESVIRNINLPFKIMEDNGGGLYLVVFNEDLEIIFLSGEYEYEHTILTNALISISNKTIDEAKSIVNSWKTNVNDFNNDRSNLNYASIYEKLTTDKIGVFTIVDNQGVYPALMGNAGVIEFKILESEENNMKEILLTLKGLTQEQGEKVLEEKGYVIDDSFSEKCVNSENYLSDTYYRIRYGNHDEWFCYTAEYIPDEDYEDESKFISGSWNCNTENDITISELEL